MSFATLSSGRIAFNLSTIMRHAHHEGRFATQLMRARGVSQAERRASFGRFLKAAWKAAKDEAARLVRLAAQEVESRAYLAGRAAENAALAASFGDADAIRNAIVSETMRERMDFARIDRLQSALASMSP